MICRKRVAYHLLSSLLRLCLIPVLHNISLPKHSSANIDCCVVNLYKVLPSQLMFVLHFAVNPMLHHQEQCIHGIDLLVCLA